jgi:hypothetical protein
MFTAIAVGANKKEKRFMLPAKTKANVQGQDWKFVLSAILVANKTGAKKIAPLLLLYFTILC